MTATKGKSKKTKQRGNRQGTIYAYRGRFRWQLRAEVNGRLTVIRSGVEETRAAADKVMRQALVEVERGRFTLRAPSTVGDCLDNWLRLRRPHVRETTFEQYELRLRLYVPESLKRMRLQEVRRSHILGLEAELATKLSASSRKKVIEHLAAAFKEAVHEDLILKNPADDIRVTPTPAERSRVKRRKALTDDELNRFLDEASGDPLFPLFYLMFSLGLRCGEALGLRWQDVDFEDRLVRIEQANKLLKNKPVIGDVKTAQSRRVLPASADLLEVLAQHRAAQMRLRASLGQAWPMSGLVFTTARGALLDRHNVQRTMHRIAARAGLEKFGTHSGRYTSITNRLRAGQLPEVVAKIAGHARVSTTLNIYRQVMPDEVRTAEFDLQAHLRRKEAAD
ncbi:tyrosine-type recombinase/integrase [Deinococcus pimensis]|uniref:tyrosine-type recombinase/integrase n=1 Tax=Deinococcus pimensis TaxID=309888 RepID=UPI0004BC4E70|nr:site-specific integrase [Deinococcus pimensis]